jgi:Tfp pilus assembly protein PilF
MDDEEVQRRIEIALVLIGRDDFSGAIGATSAVAEAFPTHVMAQLVLGVALSRLRMPKAIFHLRQAVMLAPNEAQCHYNYAVVLAENGQEDLAMIEYRKCLDIDANYADALWNYGELLRSREHFELALSIFDRLLSIEGQRRPKLLHRMAVCASHIDGCEQRAMQLFSDQLAQDDDPVTHWEYAHFLLSKGQFAEAWLHYKRRFEAGKTISVISPPNYYGKWNGKFKRGTLVIFDEQGIGDVILFSAYLPEVIQKAEMAGLKIIICGRKSLQKLMCASFENIEYIDTETPEILRKRIPDASYDRVWQVAIGDLPLYLGQPVTGSYLVPASDDKQFVREILSRIGGGVETLKIGLVLRSNPNPSDKRRLDRSVDTRQFAEAAKRLRNVAFFSLMPEEHVYTLGEMPELVVHDMSPYLDDFSRTAAFMNAMDLIVTVCTSTANLSGALGCDTHVLLKYYPDWRWANCGKWYEKVSLHKQYRWGDWSAPMEEIVELLDSLSARMSRDRLSLACRE